jgi:hypothetical protein
MTVPPSQDPEKDRPQADVPPHEERSPVGLNDYFKSHTRETIAYILMVLGIIWLFFDPLWGGVLVGLIAGSYFGDEVVAYLKEWRIGTDYKTITRNFIIGGVAIAFLVSSPAIFLGIAVSVGIKQLFVGQTPS